MESKFADVKFMTGSEKELVLKAWKLFLKSLVGGDFKTVISDGYGNKMPTSFGKFSDRLYKHLTLHCSFIAHFNRAGFYSHYFDDMERMVEFIDQFDPKGFMKSVEYGGTYWKNGDYADLNGAMCIEMGKISDDLRSQ